MHYANGREAKNGDKVVLFGYNGPVVGILYDATAGNDFCNGSIAVTRPGDPCPNLKECLHLDDVKALLPGFPGLLDLAKVPNSAVPSAIEPKIEPSS